jgi:hypothetical protein
LIPSAKTGESKVFYHKMCVSPLFLLLKPLILTVEQEGRLPPLPRRVRRWGQAEGFGR